jgi:hypothetical protein
MRSVAVDADINNYGSLASERIPLAPGLMSTDSSLLTDKLPRLIAITHAAFTLFTHFSCTVPALSRVCKLV